MRKVTTFNAYRSYQHMTRVLFAVCVILGIVNIVLASFLTTLFPLKEIQPMLVAFSDQKKQVVRIEPIERSLKGTNILIEKLVSSYVQKRESIDHITEKERFQLIYNMTSGELWTLFWDLIKLENPKSPLKLFKDRQMTRDVHVVGCFSLAPAAQDTYRIEWESIDYKQGQEINRQQWVTTLAVRFNPREVKYEDRYINPIGLEVVSYAIAKKEF